MYSAGTNLPRLWPGYHVNYDTGGDFFETTAKSEDDARRVAYIRHGQPGFRVTSVEFAWHHPRNRQMMGLV